MRRHIGILLTVLAAGAGGLAAQQPPTGTHVGVGVSLNPAALLALDDGDLGLFLPTGFSAFTFPILLGSRLRLEPEVGLLRVASKSSNQTFSSEYSATLLRLGVSAHFALATRGGLRPYVGPRIGIIRQSASDETTGNPKETQKRTDTYVGAALGGEYFFSPHFSLGGEAQLNYLMIGDVTYEPSFPGTQGESSQSVLSNTGLVYLRFYF